MASKKQPYMPFYPGDWKKDLGVQMLSFEHRMVWFEMLILMHDSEQRGVLVLNGSPLSNEDIARLIGLDKQKFEQALEQIKKNNVCSFTEDGAIYSRSMVRRAETSVKRSISGSQGGNPALLKQNSQQDSYPNSDIDIEDDNENESLKNNSAPLQPIDPADAPLYEFAESQLTPTTDPKIQKSNHFISAGRRPMRKYPEIWLTPMELVDAAKVMSEAGIPKNRLDLVFKPVAARIRGYVAEGRDPARTPAYTHITTFGLEAALKVLKATNDLERSKNYLQTAGAK